jgi:CDP-diacylglycerol--inositol 3-phosphatidyltransferase
MLKQAVILWGMRLALLSPSMLSFVLHRLSTAGLLAILGMLNRQWYFGFLVLLILDIFSHWFQMYATMVSGASTHKVK